MPSTASVALLGTGVCPYCRQASVLYTHSLAHTMPLLEWTGNSRTRQYAGCFSCERTNIRYTINCSVSEEMRADIDMVSEQFDQFITSAPYQTSNCEACERPLLDESSLPPPSTGMNNPYFAVSAQTSLDDERTIIVHSRCTYTTECCNRVLANTSGEETFYLAGRSGSLCRLCLAGVMTERGHDFQNDYFKCDGCDCYHLISYRNDFYHRNYCESCYDDLTAWCEECETRYWAEDYHDCSNNDESIILDYSYKPRPIFYGKNYNPKERLFFGLELEVESVRGDREYNAGVVKELLGERVYLKYDGSLNNGFEIVSHPHSLEAFRKEFNWSSFARFREVGLRSWNTSTCGIHIHVSRDAFGPVYESRTGKTIDDFWSDNFSNAERQQYYRTRQTHELKFIKLIYDNDRQVCRLAGRYSEDFANFADKGRLTRKVRRGETSGGRHAAVNTENDNTLEVRVFRGSLAPERVLAHLEFVHSAVEYTRDLKVSGKNIALTWLAYSSYVYTHSEQYPNLTSLMVRTFDQDSPLE